MYRCILAYNPSRQPQEQKKMPPRLRLFAGTEEVEATPDYVPERWYTLVYGILLVVPSVTLREVCAHCVSAPRPPGSTAPGSTDPTTARANSPTPHLSATTARLDNSRVAEQNKRQMKHMRSRTDYMYCTYRCIAAWWTCINYTMRYNVFPWMRSAPLCCLI